jgi:Putative adhesin
MRAFWTRPLAGLLVLFAAAVAQASDTKEVHQTIALDKNGRLSLGTYKGSVTVATWDRPEVKVDALVEPDGDDRDSREKVQLTEVRISGGGSSVEIKSDYDLVKRHDRHFMGILDWDYGSLPFVRYTIQMPATALLEIDDHKSEIRISDLKADLKLHTYKGTGRVTNLDGAARVETYKGDIRMEFARFSRASRFETHKGKIEVRLPKDSRFDLNAQASRKGDIESDFEMLSRTRYSGLARESRVSGGINGGGPELRLTTYKGTLRLLAK